MEAQPFTRYRHGRRGCRSPDVLPTRYELLGLPRERKPTIAYAHPSMGYVRKEMLARMLRVMAEEPGITQGEVAKRVGVTRRTVVRWIRQLREES